MSSVEPNPGLLRKFEGVMILSAFSIPLIVANAHSCPGSLGLLSHTNLFASFVRNDIATPDQICMYEDLLIIYIFGTAIGSSSLAREYQQRTVDLQMSRKESPNLRKAKHLLMSVLGFLLFITVFAELVPDSGRLGHFDRAFESKKFFGMMFCTLL